MCVCACVCVHGACMVYACVHTHMQALYSKLYYLYLLMVIIYIHILIFKNSRLKKMHLVLPYLAVTHVTSVSSGREDITTLVSHTTVVTTWNVSDLSYIRVYTSHRQSLVPAWS